jgi:hypothetical protein
MQKMKTDNLNLQASVLQWPHHHWPPTEPEDQETITKFLKIVNPQKIIITTPPAGRQTNSKPLLCEFLENYKKEFNPNVEILYLEDGSNRFIALLPYLYNRLFLF